MCVCDSDDEKNRSAKDLMVGAGRNSAHITVGSALPTPVPEATKMVHLLGVVRCGGGRQRHNAGGQGFGETKGVGEYLEFRPDASRRRSG